MALIGDLTTVAQLIAKISDAVSTARDLPRVCRRFAVHLQDVGRHLEPLKRAELDEATQQTLANLQRTLEWSYHVIVNCSRRSYAYRLIKGKSIRDKIREAQDEVDRILRLFPLIQLSQDYGYRPSYGSSDDEEEDSEQLRPYDSEDEYSDEEHRSGWSTTTTGGNRELSTVFTGTVEQSLDGSSRTEEAFPNLRIFAFNELKSATRSFQAANMIGEGGFGVVYRAWVDKKTLTPANNRVGMAVAVKKWKPESFQGFSEWQKEVDILGKMSHPNLINLLGYCCEDDELLLVYEFMEKGSLGNHLFPQGAAVQPLSWEQRLKIAVGAARGLAFLHAPDNRIIHRNFTSSHVLLDSNLNPKLTGLGIARESPTDAESHVSTRVMGTYGYAAPEYIATGHLTAKNDVYGMGVVLLEMLSGQRALDASRTGKQRLVEYAKPYISDHPKLARLMDPRLEGQYPVKAALCAARLAKSCVADDPKARPSMDEVVETLQQIEAMN
ncbi:unnamed protein product [Musa acuminata subsp. burmannicoides]